MSRSLNGDGIVPYVLSIDGYARTVVDKFLWDDGDGSKDDDGNPPLDISKGSWSSCFPC